MMKPANSRIPVAKLLLDRAEKEGIRTYRYSDLQRMAYEITHGEGAWERDRASLGKEYGSRFRGWYATQLTGGRYYRQGIVNFYFTKVSTPEGVRYVRNLTEHFDRPFLTMRQARRLAPPGTWHRSAL